MKNTRNTLGNLAWPALALVLIGVSAGAVEAGTIAIPFRASNFTAPRDNMYLPMAIGKTYVYWAEEEDGLVVNEITQTTGTKEIQGVETTVVHDVEWVTVEGVGTFKTEETTDWMAWDNFGNVWYFGEDTTEFLYDEDWNLIGTSKTGSWQAGVDGARPGILMLAKPRKGVSYRQEFYKGVAEDMAKVLKSGQRVSIELGEFDGCLKIKEWTSLSPGSVEHKFYAPNVGLVFIEQLRGKTVKVELVDIR